MNSEPATSREKGAMAWVLPFNSANPGSLKSNSLFKLSSDALCASETMSLAAVMIRESESCSNAVARD